MKLTPKLLLIPGVIAFVVSNGMVSVRAEKPVAQNPQMAFLSNSAFNAPILSYQPVWSRLLGVGGGLLGLTCAVGSLFPGSVWKKVIILANKKREMLVTKAETPEALAQEVSKVIETSVAVEPISNTVAVVELEKFHTCDADASAKERLIAMIEAEAPWLLRLLCCPLVFVGGQRSGKSTAAQAIALIRGIIFGGDTHWVHPHGESDRPEISSSIKLFGEKKDWDAIIAKMEAHLVEKNKPETPRTTIFDELAAMDGVIPTDLISRLWRLTFSESTKFNRLPILLTHGTTATFRGGVKGCSDVINALPTVTIKPASDAFSRPVYSNQWTLSNIQGLEADFDVIRPTWLRPEWLIEQFNLPPFYTDEAPIPPTTSARRLPPPPPTHAVVTPANPAPTLSPLAELVKERKQHKGQLRIDDLLHLGLIQAGEIHKGELKLQEIANRVAGSTFHYSTPISNPYISWS